MRNPTPAPIVVPATGAPTCRGIVLRPVNISTYEREDDRHLDLDMLIRACADRAIRDGHVLCLRPTAEGKGACVGMTPTAFAVASLADDFAARALVVDPYDRDGNDVREAPASKDPPGTYYPYEGSLPCMEQEAREEAAVAVWEGSERV